MDTFQQNQASNSFTVSLSDTSPTPKQTPHSSFEEQSFLSTPTIRNEEGTNVQIPYWLPGFRFDPTDKQLILDYLKPKISGRPALGTSLLIHEVEVYKNSPNDLAENFMPIVNNSDPNDKEWYFFTSRDRKYKNGSRPNRKAGEGYWKATGADKKIWVKGKPKSIGSKKALVYYLGKPPKGVKTNWIMHEYLVDDPVPQIRNSTNHMRLDDTVLCRIYKKSDNKPTKIQKKDATGNNGNQEQDLEVGTSTDDKQQILDMEVNNHVENQENDYINFDNYADNLIMTSYEKFDEEYQFFMDQQPFENLGFGYDFRNPPLFLPYESNLQSEPIIPSLFWPSESNQKLNEESDKKTASTYDENPTSDLSR